MGHFGQIRHHGGTGDVLAECNGQFTLGIRIGGAGKQFFKIDHFPLVVGDFDADGGFARYGGHDADALRPQGQCQIIREPRHFADFNAGRRFVFVHGDDGPGKDLHDRPFHTKVFELLFQAPCVHLQGIPLEGDICIFRRGLQEVQGWELKFSRLLHEFKPFLPGRGCGLFFGGFHDVDFRLFLDFIPGHHGFFCPFFSFLSFGYDVLDFPENFQCPQSQSGENRAEGEAGHR